MFLLAVIHQTTTLMLTPRTLTECFYWRLYIKPQPRTFALSQITSVSIGGYTSNHNRPPAIYAGLGVFLLAVIHQTTTIEYNLTPVAKVFLLAVIHQTTTGSVSLHLLNWVFLLAVIHQTTTEQYYTRYTKAVFLLAVIHQTTTTPILRLLNVLVFLLAVIHQTTTS